MFVLNIYNAVKKIKMTLPQKYFLVCKPGVISHNGKELILTADILKEIAESYNPQFHEAPLTLDHAQSGAAHGYVSDVVFSEPDGGLLVSFVKLSDEIIALTSLGRYQRPSIEIGVYNEKFYLRAVSLVPFPQVKGLPPIKLSESNLSQSYTFTSPELNISFIDTSKTNNKNMNSKIILLAESLSLPATNEEEALSSISSHITSISQKNSELEISLADIQSKIVTLQEEKITTQKKANTALVDSLIAQKKALPASKDSLIALAESAPDEFIKLAETLPVLSIFDSGAVPKKQPNSPESKDIMIDGKPVTYKDLLKDLSLQEKLTQEQIVMLRENYFKK